MPRPLLVLPLLALPLLAGSARATSFEATAITQVNVVAQHDQVLGGPDPVTAVSPDPPDLYQSQFSFNDAFAEATSDLSGIFGSTYARAGSAGSAYARSIATVTWEDLVVEKTSAALPDAVLATFEVNVVFEKDDQYVDSGSCGSGRKVCVNYTGNAGSQVVFGSSADTTISVVLPLTVGVGFDLFISADMTSNATQSKTLNQSFSITPALGLLLLPEGYHLVPEPGAALLVSAALLGVRRGAGARAPRSA